MKKFITSAYFKKSYALAFKFYSVYFERIFYRFLFFYVCTKQENWLTYMVIIQVQVTSWFSQPTGVFFHLDKFAKTYFHYISNARRRIN